MLKKASFIEVDGNVCCGPISQSTIWLATIKHFCNIYQLSSVFNVLVLCLLLGILLLTWTRLVSCLLVQLISLFATSLLYINVRYFYVQVTHPRMNCFMIYFCNRYVYVLQCINFSCFRISLSYSFSFQFINFNLIVYFSSPRTTSNCQGRTLEVK